MSCTEEWVRRLWDDRGAVDEPGNGDSGPTEIEEHLRTCPPCRESEARIRAILESLRLAPDEDPPEEPPGEAPEEPWVTAGTPDLASSPPFPPAGSLPEILTIGEAAVYLRVPEVAITDRLDELPAFEFAGEIRFRRTALDEWIAGRERAWRGQVLGRHLKGL